MIVSAYTTPELEYFRKNCNFVGREIEVFEMRSRGVSLERIAEYLGISVEGVKKVSKKVNNKIIRVM